MKANWSKFWNFFIQFFVVIIGVFCTLWVSGIAETHREKKKTRNALELVKEELTDYLTALEDKKEELELEREMCHDILTLSRYPEKTPSADTLLLYKNMFFSFSLLKTSHLSLDIAERTGAFSSINNFKVLEDIYNSFLVINTFYEVYEKHSAFKIQQISKAIASNILKPTISDSPEQESPKELKEFWENITKNEDTYIIITNGYFNSLLTNGLAENGIQHIHKAISSIEEYLN